jgi:hypothetical protein
MKAIAVAVRMFAGVMAMAPPKYRLRRQTSWDPHCTFLDQKCALVRETEILYSLQDPPQSLSLGFLPLGIDFDNFHEFYGGESALPSSTSPARNY